MLAVAIGAFSLAAQPAGVIAEDVQAPGPSPLVSSVGVSPKALPRKVPAPVAVAIRGRVLSLDGGVEPTLRTLELEADRHIKLDVTGLPACGYRRLSMLDTQRLETVCGPSIVGSGPGQVLFAYPENSPILAASEFIVFNGGSRGGVTTFYVRGVFTLPVPKVALGIVRIEEIDRGRYGLRVDVEMPVLGDGYGLTIAFDLVIGRRYSDAGMRRSVLSATCAGGRFLFRGKAVFEGNGAGSRLEVPNSVTRTCVAAGVR